MLDRNLAIELFNNFVTASVDYNDSLAYPNKPRQQANFRLTQSQLIKRFFETDTLICVHFPFRTNTRLEDYRLRIYSEVVDIPAIRQLVEEDNQSYLDQLTLLEVLSSVEYPGLFYLALSSQDLVSSSNLLSPGVYPVTIHRGDGLPIIAKVTKVRNQAIINPVLVRISESVTIKLNQWEFPFEYDFINEEILNFALYLDLQDSETDLIGIL